MNGRHYTKEEKDALIEELVEFHEENKKGARAFNKVAAMDMRATLWKIGTEVSQGVGCVVSWLTHISNKFEILRSIPVAEHLHSLHVAMSMTPRYRVRSRRMIHYLSSMRSWVLHLSKSLGN